jgi:biopolymer transport protein TolR
MNNTETNFEINLLPVISMLAVCISFLLVTVVWIPLGTLDVKQAIGESSEGDHSPSRIEIAVENNDIFIVSLEKKGQKTTEFKISDSSKNHLKLSQSIEKLKNDNPEVNMAFVAPAKTIQYQKVIHLLEVLNKLNLKEVGIIPNM